MGIMSGHPSRLLSVALFAGLAAWAPAQFAGAVPPAERVKTGFESISLAEAKEYLGYLAGPECQGRGTGQDGYQKAAEYIAKHLKEWGFKAIGDNGTYFQNVPFQRSRSNPEETLLQVGDKQFKSLRFASSADGEVEGNVAFVRATGADPSLDNPSALEGKIVVVSAAQVGRRLRQQLFTARPAAVLTVVKSTADSQWSVSRGGTRTGRASFRGEISLEVAKELAKSVRVDPKLVSLDDLLDATARLETTETSAKVVVKVQTEEVGVPNVVGLLEGSDPVLKNEVVGIGAHLDHLGVQNGTVYWGADDDGSGSTAVMLVAKALATNPVRPKRSILVMWFCGEEMGLIGSKHYVDNPIIPNEKMVCELQLDMVGRNEEKQGEAASDNLNTIHLVGSKRISNELHEMILEQNKHVGFEFEYDEEGVYTRSDHYSFAAKGIPIAFLFTGFHPDYHQPSDTIDKINFDKIVNAARLFYLTAFESGMKDGPFKRNP